MPQIETPWAENAPEESNDKGELVFKLARDASDTTDYEDIELMPTAEEPDNNIPGIFPEFPSSPEPGIEPVPSLPLKPASPPAGQRRRPPSLFWPLVLIGGGVILLLSNLGYISWSSLSLLWRLWPLLLIALGIDVLIGRRSMGGALVSSLLLLVLIGGVVALILFAGNIPMLSKLSEPVAWRVEHIAHARDGVERAHVRIDWGSPPAYLQALQDTANLIEGDIAYSGELVFDVSTRGKDAEITLDHHASGPWFGPLAQIGGERNRWEVWLNPEVHMDLDLNAGSGQCKFDLRDLQIDALYLDVGSGGVELDLPSTSSFQAVIRGGSGALTIVLPKNVGAQVNLESGSGSFRPDERFKLVSGKTNDDGVWQTENWGMADYNIEIGIDQGSGRVSIR